MMIKKCQKMYFLAVTDIKDDWDDVSWFEMFPSRALRNKRMKEINHSPKSRPMKYGHKWEEWVPIE